MSSRGVSSASTGRTRILLIRHAATDAGGRLCGSFDVPLSPQGRAQLARMLGRAAGRPAPAALLTSTLARAREVSRALAAAWALEPEPAGWAREIDCGAAEGMLLSDVQRRFPGHWARNEAQADDGFAWPGGETYASFRARILDGLRSVDPAHAGRRIAVVTHAGVISQVLGVIRRRSAAVWKPDRPRPLTATEITWQDGAPAEVLAYDEADWL